MPKAGKITIDLDLGSATLIADLNKSNAKIQDFGNQLKAAGNHGVTSIQAISGSLRVLEGSGGIRAAEKLLASFQSIRAIAGTIFPVAGAIALGEAAAHVGEKVYDLYKRWDPISQAEKRASDELKEYDKNLASIHEKIAAISAEGNIFGFGKIGGSGVNAADAAQRIQQETQRIGLMRADLADAQRRSLATHAPGGAYGERNIAVPTEDAIVAQKDAERITRELQEAQAKLAIDQAAASKPLTEGISAQIEQNAAFTKQRIENEVTANTQIAESRRKVAELQIALDQTAERVRIAGYGSAEERAIGTARLEVEAAQQRAQKIGAIDQAEAQRHIALLRQRVGAIPSTTDDTAAGIERIALGGQIESAQRAAAARQTELQAGVTRAQTAYADAVAASNRQITQENQRIFNELGRGWEEAKLRAGEYYDRLNKAQAEAREALAKSEGEVKGLEIEGEKLQVEREYGLQILHTGAQQIAYLQKIADLEAQARDTKIAGLEASLAQIDADTLDAEQVLKRQQLEDEINRLKAEAANASYKAQTGVEDERKKQSLGRQLKQPIVNLETSIPAEIANAIANGIGNGRRGEGVGKQVEEALKNAGKQLFSQELTALLEKLTAQLLTQFGVTAAQTSTIAANTAALAANTAALTANGVAGAAGGLGGAAGGAAGAASSFIGQWGGLIGGLGGGLISGLFTYFGDRKIVDAIHGTTAAVQALHGTVNTANSTSGSNPLQTQQSTSQYRSGFGGFLGGFLGLPDSSAIPVRIVQSWGDALGFKGLLGGLLGFANGGIPPINVPSLVGENGPELFVPRQAGYIVPNRDLRSPRMPSAGGSTFNSGGHTFNIQIHGIKDPDAITDHIMRHLPKRITSRLGTSAANR